MERELKFRGLRNNGEWVYGGFCRRWNNKPCIVVYNPKEREDDPNSYEDDWDIYVDVYEDTIGQFTGLLDKNGKEIYEGDILHAVGGNDATIGKQFYRSVSFVEGCFCLNVTEYNNVSIPLRNHIINHSLNWDIAGNIHDNPELIK